jgi:hypothetical protein
MSLLGGAIIETIVADYGKAEVLRRISDPCWFQALGCVLGMDWHSSGITTSVMGALKKALNPKAHELGIYICGGKGKHSRQTPQELLIVADKTGLPGQDLVRHSKLAAKVDNTALQDGFQLYLHSFIVSNEGDWAVVQQGMNDGNGMARRYHWHSGVVKDFTETPHSFIYGRNQGQILNLTDVEARTTKNGLIGLVKADPAQLLPEIRKITMPAHHDVRAENVDLKRLGAVLAVAHERQVQDFETLLLMEGVGPRTLQSLTLVSEVIHGTPSRFTDPARFSFAHGGKDGHPFPVPVNVYDETISIMQEAVNKSKIGQSDKQEAIRKLSVLSQQFEKDFIPNERFDEVIARERNDSWQHGGRTIFGKEKPPPKNNQLSLFDES